MHSIWRAMTLGIVVSLAVVLGTNVTDVSAQASDPRVGTWKLNVAKSKYNPGPAPQSQTLKVEASGKGEKITSEVVSADGKRTTSTYTANFDGKDYPLSGSALGADKVSLKRIDARTTERTDKKDGKVYISGKITVSADGKSRTVSISTTDSKGKKVSNTYVYDKE